ncbi:MAG: hypothetical protein CVU38_08485 [Chloroflexi bacterium HGW-Chloroflexi-1]|nr:MAG: hypothetical protein CVU38_08485 [Chloroflexi bacterium HGW-Chloroflexi-1]
MLLGLLLALAPGKASQGRATRGFDLAVLAFVDINGDGVYGLSQGGPEPVLSGIEVRLCRDHPPLLSIGKEDIWLATQTTNPDGYVVFRNISAGDYILLGSVTDGYLPTTPLEQYTRLEGNGGGAVLEFVFGQLARSEFKGRFIFPLIGVP